MALVGLVLAFAAGRYSAPIKTVTIEREAHLAASDSRAETITKQTVSYKVTPSGDKNLKIETLQGTASRVLELAQTQIESKSIQEARKRSTLLFQAIARVSTAKGPGFGAAVSARLIGPITIGLAYLPERPLNLVVGVEL